MEDLHQSANILLAHYHYYKGDIDIPSVDWKDWHQTRLAHLNTHEVGFFYTTAQLLKEKSRGVYTLVRIDI
jgi:hypothetical protein